MSVRKGGSASSGRAGAHRSAPGRRFSEHGFTPRERSAEHGFTFTRRFAEHGFTLIETLVALAVFSIAALALLRLEGATVRAAARLQDRQLGQIVARNVALAALTDPVPPALGASDGEEENGGRAWTWRRAVARIGDGDLLKIDVRVADAGGVPSGTLTVLRSAR